MSNAAIPLLNVMILGSFMLFCVAQMRAIQMTKPARVKARVERAEQNR
jgi:hypothetical protein